jgi:hypothetical protein
MFKIVETLKYIGKKFVIISYGDECHVEEGQYVVRL